MSFRLVPKSVTLNGVMALILHYFTEFGSFLGALHKSGWRYHHKESSRSLSHLLMSFLFLQWWWIDTNGIIDSGKFGGNCRGIGLFWRVVTLDKLIPLVHVCWCQDGRPTTIASSCRHIRRWTFKDNCWEALNDDVLCRCHRIRLSTLLICFICLDSEWCHSSFLLGFSLVCLTIIRVPTDCCCNNLSGFHTKFWHRQDSVQVKMAVHYSLGKLRNFIFEIMPETSFRVCEELFSCL